MIVAAEFNKSTINGLFSSIALHAAPISLNLISNSLLKSDPVTSSNQITTVNHPVELETYLFTVSGIKIHKFSLYFKITVNFKLKHQNNNYFIWCIPYY